MQRSFNSDYERIKKLATDEAEKVDEKLKSGKYNSYQRMKLQEQKYTPGLFSEMYSAYNRYRSPW